MVNIYTLSNPETLEIRYVGKTKHPLNRRLNGHIWNRKSNAKVSKWVLSLYRKGCYPIIELLEECNEDNWEDTERYWIAQFKTWGFTLMNTAEGGESGCSGYNHTEEAKRAIAEKNSKPKSLEWMENTRVAMTKTVSKTIIQLDINNNFIRRWDSFCFAAKDIRPNNYKAAIKNIHACCNNKRKSAYGYKWKYESVESKDKEPLR